jgi:MFS transporter, AAHS family, vanillate permease
VNANPRDILANEPMNILQVVAVTVCVLLTALDGFDVLSISFASPGIAAEWGINRAALGVVLSMELIGMAVGSVIFGTLADSLGRRPTVFVCLFLMATGMYLASTASNVQILSVYRLATGLGIGGMLATVNAFTAEYSNARRRNLAVVLMAAGYPIGAIVGGSIASALLVEHDWRSVFLLGAGATAAFFPLVWLFLPESVAYLADRQPPGALERINRTLERLGHATIDALPAPRERSTGISTRELFTPRLRRITILLTLAYFLHIMTFYFILKWIPKIVVDMGFEPSTAGGVLVWANVGGLAGSLLIGFLSLRMQMRGLLIAALLLSAVGVTLFGLGQGDLHRLSLAAAGAGFFTNAAVVGMYALFAQMFPTDVRAGGTGFAIGVGRGGSAMGPMLAGVLFAAGGALSEVAIAMAAGSLIAAVLIAFTPAHPDTRPQAGATGPR